MTDKTWDAEDPRELPYRFVWSPNTQEVLIVTLGRVMGYFENREAFHRFLIEGNATDSKIQDLIPDAIKDITEG